MELWGGGGVRQLELYSGTDAISAITGSTNYTLSDSATNYDYLVVKIIADEVGTQTEKLVLVDASSTKLYEYSGNAQAQENSRFNGWLQITNSITLAVALRYKGTNVNSVCLASVVGIKYIDTDIKNATSLDETLLYSGNDYINDKTGFREYTLADMADNYDYLLVRSSAVSIDDGNVISTYNIISPPFIDNVNKLIPFNFWYESQDAYNSSIQNLYYFSGWFRLDGTKLFQVGLRGLGSHVNNFYVEKVVGIKKNSLSTAGIAEMAMPSDVYISTGFVPGDTWSTLQYEAPANGFVSVSGTSTHSSGNSIIWHENGTCSSCGATGQALGVLCPVHKGDKVTLGAQKVNNGSSYFIYSVGDAKALGLMPTPTNSGGGQ